MFSFSEQGVLADGKAVAIKRLFFNTRQWVDHFFNEVNLISGIRHKNLVELLGCSITGPESLLVYEYVPNQSLHDNLFGGSFVPKGGPPDVSAASVLFTLYLFFDELQRKRTFRF